MSMIAKNARIALNIIDKLCRRLQAANSQIQHLVKRNEKDLIALSLFHAFAEHDLEKGAVELHRTCREISMGLEIPQDRVLEYLREMEKQGIVKADKGQLFLTNKNALAEVAEGAGAVK